MNTLFQLESADRCSDVAASAGSGLGVKRFWLLDNLRGIASFSVVLWHYQHFYYVGPGVLPADFHPRDQPLFSLLRPIYLYGANAVELFYVLSGFVFFFVYYEAISQARTTASAFFVARFSRLYPLYAVTLLFVAFGQWWAVSLTGRFFVYPYNDAYHFILSVFFASHWGLERGF